MWAMLLHAVCAGFAVTLLVHASSRLSADADSIANFDVFDLGANTDGMANDFVTHADRIVCREPSRTQSMKI